MDEAVLEELYSAPLDEFVARRSAIAKRLRGADRRDEAAEVAELRKPTVPVWAANQLARRNRPAVAALLRAGDELRTAIGKGDRDAFAEAQRKQTEALRRLREATRRLLDDPTDATLERAISTFRAASIDQELRPALEAGRLTDEPEPGGFDTLAGLTFAGQPRRRAEPKRREDGHHERLKRARDAVRDAKTRYRELERAARAAEREAEQARRAADEAAAAVAAAEAEAEAIRKR